jgi:hypothetical protein
MSTEHKINGTTKWVLIFIALFFDLVQFITPGLLDTFVTASAALVCGMIFIEKGAFTIKGPQALRYARLITFVGELLISILPAITLTVIIQIAISRLADKTPVVKKLLRKHRLTRSDVTGERATAKREVKKIGKYVSGKGRRSMRKLIPKK